MKLRTCIFPALVAIGLLPFQQCTFLRRVSVSPTRLTFAPRVVGSGPSGSQLVTLKNTSASGTSVVVSSIVASGNYSQTNDCPSSLPSGAACHINVTFNPQFAGTILGGLTINDNANLAPVTPQLVSLSGTGITPVAFSPSSLNFGTDPVGTTTVSKNITVTNRQSSAINITGIAISGDYHQINDCPASLPSGSSCTVKVLFQPTSVGAIPGALQVSTSASPGTQPVALSGAGSGSVSSRVSFSQPIMSFGTVVAGSQSATKVVTLRNTSSSSSLSIVGISSSVPNYVLTNNCVGKLISPNGTCTISVSFRPTANFAPIIYPGAITVVDSAVTSPQVIGLNGAGVPPVTSSPALLTFDERGLIVRDLADNTKHITLTNTQSVADTLSLSSSAGYTILNNGCSTQVPAKGKCSFDLLFKPKLVGTNNGAVTVTPASTGSLRPEIVSVTGCGSTVDLSDYVLKFGSAAVGSTSSALGVTVTNTGAALTFNSISITGTSKGDFKITQNTCGSGLATGASCSVQVAFKPTASGARSAALSFSDNGACTPQKTTLIGTGT